MDGRIKDSSEVWGRGNPIFCHGKMGEDAFGGDNQGLFEKLSLRRLYDN